MKKKLLLWLIVCLCLMMGWSLYSSKYLLEVSEYTIESDVINKPIRIVHLTDLHNSEFGKENVKLVSLIQKQQPDIILITGDLVNSNNPKYDIALNLVSKLTAIAPVYISWGNHEAAFEKKYGIDLEDLFKNAGANVMEYEYEDITVNEQKDLLETTEKGQVKSSITNAELILSYDPLLRGAIRFNELTQRVDIVRPLGWDRGSSGKALTDNDLYNIHLYCERSYGISSLKLIEEALHIVANRNSYHPVRDFLNSLEWDGQERVRFALRHFLGADASDYTYEILKFFMLGAISRVFKPGTKFDYIICVVGDQGAGKSTFFRLLAVDDEWFTDDLKDLESGKVYEKLQGHWIIELSEMLATNNAKSNEAIKSFLSRQKEIYRTPYERYPKDRPRQCVFAGTTNKISFLPSDRTGNRRFLPIACQESEAEVFILDNEAESRAYIRQMWAEIMAIWRSGKVKLKLSPEMAAEVRNRQRQFMQEDVDAGLILAFMQEYDGNMVCSKQLFKEALGNDLIKPQRWQTNEINDIMNQLIRDGTLAGWRYFDSPRRFTGTDYGTQKGWERVQDANEGVSTDEEFHQLTMGETTPFDK